MKLKKLLSVAVAAVAAVIMTVPAFAATGINTYEAELLEKLQTEVTTQTGAVLSLPDNYISQAKTYMSSKTDLTKAEVDEMFTYINATIKAIKASDANGIRELMDSDVGKVVVSNAKKVAAVIGLTLKYNWTTHVVTVYDANGNIIFSTDSTIKITGAQLSDYASNAAAAAVCVIALGAGIALVTVARKRMNEDA